MRHESCGDKKRVSDLKRPKRQRSDDFLTNALTVILAIRSLIVRSGLPWPHLGLLVMRAAISKNRISVSRQNEQGDDGDEEMGA